MLKIFKIVKYIIFLCITLYCLLTIVKGDQKEFFDYESIITPILQETSDETAIRCIKEKAYAVLHHLEQIQLQEDLEQARVKAQQNFRIYMMLTVLLLFLVNVGLWDNFGNYYVLFTPVIDEFINPKDLQLLYILGADFMLMISAFESILIWDYIDPGKVYEVFFEEEAELHLKKDYYEKQEYLAKMQAYNNALKTKYD